MTIQINRTFIAGNLTRTPEVRFLSNEKAVAKFGLASNKKYRTAAGEQREEVVFVDVECWGRVAENVGQYLSKGSPALVEGSLKLDQWEDSEGKKRSRLLIRADMVHFLGAPREQQGQRSGAQSGEPSWSRSEPSPTDLDDGDAPF